MSYTAPVTVPRETSEVLPLLVVVDGAATITYETALVKGRDRPAVWTPAVADGPYTGVQLVNLTRGEWHVFVRVLGLIVDDVSTVTVT